MDSSHTKEIFLFSIDINLFHNSYSSLENSAQNLPCPLDLSDLQKKTGPSRSSA